MSFRNYVKPLPAWTAGQADIMSLLQRCSKRAPHLPKCSCQEDLTCVSSAGNSQTNLGGETVPKRQRKKQGRRPVLGEKT